MLCLEGRNILKTRQDEKESEEGFEVKPLKSGTPSMIRDHRSNEKSQQ